MNTMAKNDHRAPEPDHHPSEELLMDYASGGLSEAWSLGIATHLALCPACRKSLARMEAIGGGLLEGVNPSAVSANTRDAVMAALDEPPGTVETAEISPVPRVKPDTVLPEPLWRYLGGDVDAIEWTRLGLGAYQCVVPTGDPGVSARLLRIPAGRPVPEHTHRGLELTVVLQGAFTDHSGRYARGDFEEADEQVFHQPWAAKGEDCICLAITDAPLRFSGIVARIAQPFIGI